MAADLWEKLRLNVSQHGLLAGRFIGADQLVRHRADLEIAPRPGGALA